MLTPPVEKLKIIKKYFCEKNQTLGLAESCTGGLVSYWLTHLPGSSKYFKGSLVSYQSEVKIEHLKLDPEFVKQEGLANEKAVELMAQGVKNLLKTDWAVSVSGIAGPDSGDLGEPVGQIAFSVHSPFAIKSCVKNIEAQNRENIRHQAAIFALDFLISELK